MKPEQRVVIETERLVFEPFAGAHAPEITSLIGDVRIADMTGNIPHPYTEEHAHGFARMVEDSAGDHHAWILRERTGGALVGGVGLRAFGEGGPEIGYWVGVPYWGRGYATEALVALLAHAFGALGLHRVHACYFLKNPASLRVMEKAGMTPCHTGSDDGCVDNRGVREPIGRLEMTRKAWETRGGGERA